MSGLAVLFDGNMGWAILALALAVRLALLPLSLHLARRMRSNQEIIASLEPQVAAGVGLYWAASSLVSGLQACVLRFDRRRLRAARP
jgi:membrane protein insertase Oxa1/YidC/SpoIIIJ